MVPPGAPNGTQDQVVLTATFNYDNASPALESTHTVTDLTRVGTATTAGLDLVKEVDKTSAKSSDNVTYTVTYKNLGSGELSNVVIFDRTPAFTTFVSAAFGALPSNLSSCVITNPAVGSKGDVVWTFTGTLAPGSAGTITYTVKVE